MRQKSILLALCLLGTFMAKANNNGPGNGSKDELNGVVIHAETKKPLKDVSITAYLNNSRKEKIVISDEAGGFNFDELKPGVYKFVFEKTGFKKVTREKVVIKTDEAFQMQIEMIAVGDYEILPSPFSIGGF
ncbi:MAG: carboxypeptidase regulatory-like domain-containing protein [Sphingobacteriales bacterium]|nr:carboxypeptidase regulatory-like domain-containing protein [Sphingobacteriales bacterium]